MAVTATPVFAQAPICGIGQTSTADTALDNPTTSAILLYTAGANGGRLEYVRAKCAATSAAAVVRIFISTDGGTTKRLWAEILIVAATSSNTVACAEAEYVPTRPLMLPASAKVYFTTSIAQLTNCYAHGGDL